MIVRGPGVASGRASQADCWAGDAHAARNSTYKAPVLIGKDYYSLYYPVWCIGDTQYYVMKASIQHQKEDPWKALYQKGEIRILNQKGEIRILKDPLEVRFDAFYHEQPKVSFESCEPRYVQEKEGPQDVDVFKDADHHVELRR
ncbi:hypothetical protein MKZ38_005686 [Zalerion maritima]|uniref:Uncharacterized protein n=1 Tax=Zalerion maritima TaxID=339359 RepID=A0AAD5RKE4_9PEZI|nr:hypothetical protein MKZ38_005686 [Zalerion maritima]